jgi:2'-5' RNA ligase
MFVAAWPDDPTSERLSSLTLGPAGGLTLVRPGQWHVTLRFLGEVTGGIVPALVAALATTTAEFPDRIRCEAGPGTAWFTGARVLQIPVSGLDEVADAVRSATLPVIPDTDHRHPTFTGHVTVARSKRGRLDAAARTALAGIPFSASFEIDHLDLVASQPSPEGPGYTTLARVPLHG